MVTLRDAIPASPLAPIQPANLSSANRRIVTVKGTRPWDLEKRGGGRRRWSTKSLKRGTVAAKTDKTKQNKDSFFGEEEADNNGVESVRNNNNNGHLLEEENCEREAAKSEVAKTHTAKHMWFSDDQKSKHRD